MTRPAQSRGDAAALPRGGEELRRTVCERIATWPMETKSLLESVEFLAELKGTGWGRTGWGQSPSGDSGNRLGTNRLGTVPQR